MPTPSAVDLLAKAQKRLDELEAERAALQIFIRSYGELIRTGPSHTDSDDDQLSLLQGPVRKVRKERIDQTIAAARHLIMTEGRPMRRGELVRNLLAQGYQIEGTDKNKVFGTNLWRSGKFIVIEGRGYWPKDVPLPRLKTPVDGD